jgi:two-component sensor histidine kinase
MIGKVRESYGEIENANEELRKAKEGLEETVRERVKELVAVNARLEGEIAERKRNEDFLNRANREKGTLIHEIHHRVKNNLQVIASILRLKSGKIKNADDLAAFKESDALIRSISMIHEKLYAKDDVSEIKMGEYLTELVGGLPMVYGVAPEKIRWTVSAEDVMLGADKAIPCGLIANELATNVIKYAFPGDASGEAKIVFFRSGENTLDIVVSDNGVGFQPDKIGGKPDSVGLELVSRIAKDQLGGTMEIISGGNKTEIRVRFRETD